MTVKVVLSEGHERSGGGEMDSSLFSVSDSYSWKQKPMLNRCSIKRFLVNWPRLVLPRSDLASGEGRVEKSSDRFSNKRRTVLVLGNNGR